MQSCKLPIEVCERVIDCLALSTHNLTVGDYGKALEANPTLYACLLVCRDWAHRSQHHLFRCIILRTTSQADAFLTILALHPHRAQLVQFLRIWPHPPPSPPSSPKSVSPSLRPSDSLAPTSSTVSTLPSNSPAPSASSAIPSHSHSSQISVSISNDQQSNVEEAPPQLESGNLSHPLTAESPKFNVSLRDQTQDKVEGKTAIPPCYYNWIYKVLTRLPLLLINLSNLHLHEPPTLHPRFIRLMSCFKTIQTLILVDFENQSFSEIIQVVNRLPQLRFIYFNHSKWDRPVRFFSSRSLCLEGISCFADDEHMNADTLDWLASLQDLSSLQFLQMTSFQSSDRNKVHHILHHCMYSLRYLGLRPIDADIFESLSLSNHSKLEGIDICTPSLHLPKNLALFSSRIFQLLSPSLIYLVIGFFENLDLESLATSQSSWKDIDDALSHPNFNRLAYFVMNLPDSYEGNINHETLRATFQKILPQSYQRGILWVGKYIGTIDDQRAFHICKDDEREFSIYHLERTYLRM